MPRVSIAVKLEALDGIAYLHLLADFIFNLIFELKRHTPHLTSLVEKDEVLLLYVVGRQEELVHLGRHLALHEVGKAAHLIVKVVFAIQFRWLH